MLIFKKISNFVYRISQTGTMFLANFGRKYCFNTVLTIKWPPYFTYGQSGKNTHFDLQNYFLGQNQVQKWGKIWLFIYFMVFDMECLKLFSSNFWRMCLQRFRRFLPSFKALWHTLFAGWWSEGWKMTAKFGTTFCDIRKVLKLWRAVSLVLFELESWNFFW